MAASSEQPELGDSMPCGMGSNDLLCMPEPVLYKIMQELCPDARDLMRASLACKALQSTCDDVRLWQRVLELRFGENILPAIEQSDLHKAAKRDGWVFYQGLTVSSKGAPTPRVGPVGMSELESAFNKADNAGCVAVSSTCEGFTRSQLLRHSWRWFSFDPRHGLYVKETVVEEEGLFKPPETTARDPWPVDYPGWTFYPGAIPTTAHCCNPSCYASWSAPVPPKEGPPPHYCPDLPSLLREWQQRQMVAPQAPGDYSACPASGDWMEMQKRSTVAVTTCGCSLEQLPPIRCWRWSGEWGRGVYVPHVVRETPGLELPLPPREPTAKQYRDLYGQQTHLRLDAVHMGAAWDNSHYLERVEHPQSPSGQLLRLNTVCWLDVGGNIPGVPPGKYKVLWHMDLRNPSTSEPLHMSARATPHTPPTGTDWPSSSSSSASAAAVLGSDSLDEAIAAAEAGVTTSMSQGQLRQLEWQPKQGPWHVIDAGVLQVAVPSTVHLRFWNTSGWWKSGLGWAYVQLQPVEVERPGVLGGWFGAGGSNEGSGGGNGGRPGSDGGGGSSGGKGWRNHARRQVASAIQKLGVLLHGS